MFFFSSDENSLVMKWYHAQCIVADVLFISYSCFIFSQNCTCVTLSLIFSKHQNNSTAFTTFFKNFWWCCIFLKLNHCRRCFIVIQRACILLPLSWGNKSANFSSPPDIGGELIDKTAKLRKSVQGYLKHENVYIN